MRSGQPGARRQRGAIASESDHLTPASTVNDATLIVSRSILIGNRSSGAGGGIYLDTSTATIGANLVVLNSASLGDDIFAKSSRVNGRST